MQAPKASSIWAGSKLEQVRFGAFLLFLGLLTLAGGSSWANAWSLLLLRPATVLFIGLILISSRNLLCAPYRPLFWMLGIFAALILLQLLPLPPSVWTILPGRTVLAETALLVGEPQGWRPLSMTPERTLSSFLALLTPLAVLVGMAAIRQDQRGAALLFVPIAALFSATLGILQFAGGEAFQLYQNHHEGLPNGVFANRNHQALLLSTALLFLGFWAAKKDRHRSAGALAVALIAVLLLVATLLATGSRTGMLLGIAAIGIGCLAFASRGPMSNARWGVLGLAAAVTIALIILTLSGRALAIDRLIGFDPASEQRLRTLPVVLDLLKTYWTVGSGFGSFDPLFRMAEPDHLLRPTYFNHAHNDLLELIMTGGVPAIALLVAFIIWWFGRSVRALGAWNSGGQSFPALAASLAILFALLASLTDYPLRTPLLAGIFTIACAWLASASAHSEGARRQD